MIRLRILTKEEKLLNSEKETPKLYGKITQKWHLFYIHLIIVVLYIRRVIKKNLPKHFFLLDRKFNLAKIFDFQILTYFDPI